jgi:thiosulfate/3-mercaptopyruvate sulfurtransferase
MKPSVIALALAAAFVAFAADIALIQPKELAAGLGTKGPVVIQVGPNVLYRSKHVPGSLYAGPGNMAKGLELLKAAVDKLPRTQEIVIYCGCCPWDVCPNIKPAAETLRGMGFTRVKAMYLHTNFKTDWIDQGLPVEPR